jgi:cytoskeletal protein CcmA (bactofilin family)
MWSATNQSDNEIATRPSSLNPLDKSVIGAAPAATLPEPIPASAPRNATLNSAEQASIGRSLVIKGEVSGSESLYIEGKVQGSISLSGSANRVTVGKTGVVVADLNAREIVVMGKVQGNLVASDRVDIRNEGSLAGDVVTQRITIEDGAFFKGSIDVRKT